MGRDVFHDGNLKHSKERRRFTMLEKLYTVPWSELEHAYGEGSIIPLLIQDLTSPEQEVYNHAINELQDVILHQESNYSATPYVVPFLCELLSAPEVQNKPNLLLFLITIAYCSYTQPTTEKDKESTRTHKRIGKHLSWKNAAHYAVTDGYATYISLLWSQDWETRTNTAHLLSYCQSHAGEIAPLLQQRLFQEENPHVRACLFLSLGKLLPQSEETSLFFTRILQNEKDPLIQITTAMGYAHSMREQAKSEFLHVLLQGFEFPLSLKEQFSIFPFEENNFDANISDALRAIGLSISSLVIPPLIRAVRGSTCWDGGFTLVSNLLYFAFDDKKITDDTSVSDLTHLQKEVLTTTYETKGLWELDNMKMTVGSVFESSESNPYYSRNNLHVFLTDDYFNSF